jgi:N-acetylmuramoyl-L-alanine amidase/putative methionine-R-sulfoxide reductase with GAF domain
MSANPTNASLSLTNLDLSAGAPESGLRQILPETRVSAPGHEALQALLAFSSLHEQIRQKRAREINREVRLSPDDVWELEQFVLDEVLQLVAERALTITGADGIAIALAEGNAIVCRASAGTIAPDAGVRLDPNSGFSGACLRREEIVRCDDAESDARVNVHACRALGARSMVAVPLTGRHSVIGLLEAFSTEAYGFNDSDVRSLNLLAELILSALKPEEEDRLAEISRQVVRDKTPPLEAAKTKSDTEPEPRIQAPTESSLEQHRRPAIVKGSDRPNSSRPGLRVVLLMILVALALGGAVWWNIQRTALPTIVSLPARVAPAARAQQVPPSQEDEQQSIAASETPLASESDAVSAVREKLAVLPQVTGIRHWSSAASSTVAIDLKDQVQYEAHRLSKPERIYFDLHDTALAPGLFGKTIEIGDALLVRIRIAQPMPGVSRVVLETKGGSNFSVSLESNPYRLLVQVRHPGATTQPAAKINLFTPNSVAQANKQLASSHQGLSNRQATLVPMRALKLRLALDAGHGGWDLGTVGRRGLMEKDLVLDIVERLGKLVENGLDAEVVYTRDDDTYVALEKRAEIANLSRADLFVSIHANYSASSTARGVETYYTNTYSSLHARTRETDSAPGAAQNVSWTNVDIREKVQESRRVAGSVQRELYDMLKINNSGIRDRGVKEAQYVVLTGTSMPAILAEVSFVSSPADENNLQSSSYRQRIAEALYKGIARYTAESGRVKLASTSGKPTGR